MVERFIIWCVDSKKNPTPVACLRLLHLHVLSHILNNPESQRGSEQG